MTSLKAVLASPDYLKRCKVKPADLLLLPRAIAQLSGEGTVTDPEATEALQKRIIATAGHGVLSGRDLREGAKVFFHPPYAPGRMAEVLNAFVGDVRLQARRSALFALIDCYLDHFTRDDEHIRRLGGHLEAFSKTWTWRDGDGWPDKHVKYKLFDADSAPGFIAREVMASDLPPGHILADAGLNNALRRKGGLAAAVFAESCKHVSRLTGAVAVARQKRLIMWAQIESDTLTWPEEWPDFAAALFLPWKTSSPAAEHQNRLLDVAIRFAGDPRVQPRRWKPVDESALEVVTRWLTKASFEQFFAIVDEMTDRPDMWRERKRFWSRYLDDNHISAAWVVFGAEGVERARRAARQTGNEALLMFGRLAPGGGRTPQHTALIMTIGDLTVVEWSHNGKWNIWRRNAVRIPSLNKPEYNTYELMDGPINGIHDAHGGWQGKIRNHIYQETGLRP